MNDIFIRTLSAIFLGVLVITGILYLPIHLLKLSIVIVSVLSVYEMAGLLREKIPSGVNFSILSAGFVLSILALFVDLYAALFVGILYSFYLGSRYWNLDYTLTVNFIFLYGVILISSMGYILEKDRYLMFLILGIVWTGDTFAYIFGKAIGKHKLAVLLSPKKTWEGAVAGFIGSVFSGILIIKLSNYSFLYLIPVVTSAILMQVGDLFESFIKRQVNKKDSSNIIPGHGGVLDRIDSLIFASVVFFVWLNIKQV